MLLAPSLLLLASSWSLASAHMVLSYPGWRGDSLATSGSVQTGNGLGVYSSSNNSVEVLNYPYGQEWIYPCGGVPTTQNRTYWPTTGGAVGLQPGWFQGHSSAFMYINLGLGTLPPNMSHPMVPPFQILGPSNEPYPNQSICLTQVPLPVNITVQPGDNATIQVVEIAQHGAALYSCVDITFAEPGSPLIPEVNSSNCQNTSAMGFDFIFTTKSLTAGAAGLSVAASTAQLWALPLVAVAAALFV